MLKSIDTLEAQALLEKIKTFAETIKNFEERKINPDHVMQLLELKCSINEKIVSNYHSARFTF